MKRSICAAVAMMCLAAPAWADVKMTQNVTSKGMGIGGTAVSTTYIKGLKMRTDIVTGDTTRTTIFDVEGQKMFIFDSKKKEADVWDMAEFAKQVGTTTDPAGMTASLKANGQTKSISGKSATGYDMLITLPANLGGKDDGMKMTVNLTGPVWVVKGAPGSEDYLRFYKAAAEKGFIFSDPRAAKAQGGQAKAMAEMYKQFAATGGVPYETEMNIKMSGEGPMAGMMARMGNISSTSTVQAIETASLDDALFAPPAGYKVSAKK